MADAVPIGLLARDSAIRQCLWPLIRFARHAPTGRMGLIVGRRRARRHGWDLLVAWGRGAGREWLPCVDLKLEEAGDRPTGTVVQGGRS